ncbi:MAG TPA: T9SS type A sorting domain-containing protein [Candidatus Kapabacteria bacterium]|nr:T9SS type A sorting domain-containing protein [Candidatus Kapabacteria bacterium]HPO62601.1 T9SS type A sorting domain-containing protein [Candidatus Kapabacteria bacterium]
MRYYVLLLLVLVSINLQSQTREDYILTSPLNNDTICPGANLTLTATASGHFLSGNIFYAELSDVNGEFTVPDTIGSLPFTNNEPQIIQVNIPITIPRVYTFGTLYRLRVVSSEPQLVGTDNGFDVTIDNFPLITISGEPYACLGDTIVYSASTSTDIMLWTVSGGQIVGAANGQNVSVYWNSIGNHNITLSYETLLGCASSAYLDVEVSTKPTALIVGPVVVCVNEEKVYYAADNSSTDFSWSVIGGNIIGGAGTDSITINWITAGEARIILNQGNNGCIATDTLLIDVASNPFPEIDGKEIVCENSIEIYKTHGEGLSFLWTVEGGTIIDSEIDSTVSVFWENPGTGKITIQQTNYAYCTNNKTMNVIIERKPNPSIIGEGNVCYNNYQRYKTPANSNTNEWLVQGGEITSHISDNEVEILWNGGEDGLITLIQTNTAGCKDTVRRDIIINPLPTPAIYGDSYFCQYSTAEYAASLIAGYNNKWTVQGGEIIEQKSSDTVVVRWNNYQNTSIMLTQTTISGCIDSLVLPVSIVAYPDVTINGELNACAQQLTTYSTPNETADISWEVSGGTIDGAADNSEVKVIWDNPGEGILKLKKVGFSLGCTDSSLITVQINPKPATPTITREGDSLKSSLVNGNQWYFGFDEQYPINNATSQYYTPFETGYYSVKFTDENGCISNLSELFYFEFSSVDDIISNSNITVYPNPAKNKINILANLDYNNAQISIFNILGETILSIKEVDLHKDNVFSIDLNNCPAGSYFIQIKQKDIIYNNKIIIE